MKARLYGIDVEGTPEEIATLVKLVGAVEKVAPTPEPIRYVPYPYAPWYQPIQPYITWTDNGTSAASVLRYTGNSQQ